MKFTFLVENKTDNPGIMAEHGLSIYIEADDKKILFDAGASSLFAANAKEMKVNLEAVDFAVVSHGHYDHTGGFPRFCKMNSKAPIYIHKNAFRKSYGTEDGKIEDVTCGIRWTEKQCRDMEKRFILTDGPLWINEKIVITGGVTCEDGFMPTEKFYYRDKAGQLITDDMSHEQCLVIREPSGLYIFSGCSHRGVVSALNTAKALFPGERVAVLVAGMHLYNASHEDRKRVVQQIAEENMDRIMPVHCTGIEAICELKARMGDSCIVATAGDCFDGR